MFTGIVEETGTVKNISDDQICISCNRILEDLHIGDSIAVNGVCLTATGFSGNDFTADVSPSTKRVTNLSELKINDKVNLERAMSLSSRFGGHIVSGHIDCVSKILSINKLNEFYEVKIKLQEKEYQKYVAEKGSICVNGISLTITEINNDVITLMIIPHTFLNTNFNTLKINDNVNIEFDIIAKYIEKNLLMKDNKCNITQDFLKENGFI